MNYKGANINTAGTARPWGAREEQAWRDVIDSQVVDTVTGVVEPVTGHKHYRLFDAAENARVTVLGDFVGIYTQAPQYTLHARHDQAADTVLCVDNRNAAGSAVVEARGGAGSASFQMRCDNSGAMCELAYIHDELRIRKRGENNYLKLESNAVDGHFMISTAGTLARDIGFYGGVTLVAYMDASEARWGFGTVTPAELVHIEGNLRVNAGVVGVNTIPRGADVVMHVANNLNANTNWQANAPLVVEDTDHTYINIRTPNDKQGGVVFSNPDNVYGALLYAHGVSSTMSFVLAGATQAKIQSDGNFGIGVVGAVLDRLVVEGNVQAPDSNFFSNSKELADDTAYGFDPGKIHGAIAITIQSTGVGAVIGYNAGDPAAIVLIAQDASGTFVVATGALASEAVTGTDAKYNVNAHTDGKIYLKNRTGATLTASYTLLND